MLEKAIRLNPMPPSAWYVFLGSAFFNAERYDEAVTAGQKAVQLSSNSIFAHLLLVLSYSMTGRDQEARKAAAAVLRIQPNFSVDSFASRLPYKDPAVVERQVSIYHKAGLK
jgi:tetratricopeptide (TPR) repeat protein